MNRTSVAKLRYCKHRHWLTRHDLLQSMCRSLPETPIAIMRVGSALLVVALILPCVSAVPTRPPKSKATFKSRPMPKMDEVYQMHLHRQSIRELLLKRPRVREMSSEGMRQFANDYYQAILAHPDLATLNSHKISPLQFAKGISALRGDNSEQSVNVQMHVLMEDLLDKQGAQLPYRRKARAYLGQVTNQVMEDTKAKRHGIIRKPSKAMIFPPSEVDSLKEALIEGGADLSKPAEEFIPKARQVFRKIYTNKATAIRTLNKFLRKVNYSDYDDAMAVMTYYSRQENSRTSYETTVEKKKKMGKKPYSKPYTRTAKESVKHFLQDIENVKKETASASQSHRGSVSHRREPSPAAHLLHNQIIDHHSSPVRSAAPADIPIHEHVPSQQHLGKDEYDLTWWDGLV